MIVGRLYHGLLPTSSHPEASSQGRVSGYCKRPHSDKNATSQIQTAVCWYLSCQTDSEVFLQTVLTRAISTKDPEIVHLLMKDSRTQAIKSVPVRPPISWCCFDVSDFEKDQEGASGHLPKKTFSDSKEDSPSFFSAETLQNRKKLDVNHSIPFFVRSHLRYQPGEWYRRRKSFCSEDRYFLNHE